MQTMTYDVLLIGGGQSALACGYYLRRTALDYLLLDKQATAGGAWLHGWDSLTTFSPARTSSLPGWLMPPSDNEYPHRDEVIAYLQQYEARYELPVRRPVEVERVTQSNDLFYLETSNGTYRSRTLISATGTWAAPYFPDIPGRNSFQGQQLHSSAYRSPEAFWQKRVLVIGEGNSGAQILADLLPYATTHWAVRRTPEFLPADVDGKVLFDQASAKYYAQQQGEHFDASKLSLGTIVQVPSVREALKRGQLQARGQIARITPEGVRWKDGTAEAYDVLIWCTGFRYATQHLRGLLPMDERGMARTQGTRALDVPGLWLVGYGGWTGFASATMIGVGRTAKRTVREVEGYLD